MSGTENNIQSLKPRVSKSAVASLTLGVLAFLILNLRVFILIFPDHLDLLLINVMGVVGICGFIFGIVTVAKISRLALVIVMLLVVILFIQTFIAVPVCKSNSSVVELISIVVLLTYAAGVCIRESKNKGFLKHGIIAFVGLVLTSFIFLAWMGLAYWYKPELPCDRNIFKLGQAMEAYARKHNGQFPDPNQWCDLLLKSKDVSIENFICPSIDIRNRKHEKLFLRPVPKVGRCQFAMNPNCKRDSPEDTILLFEAKEGWNQFGGLEILLTERHRKYGSMIVLKDGRTQIVKEDLIAQLIWGAEEKDSESIE